jgi:16S rRNA (cytidine1402-2'-O)-methyltransferase
MPKGRLYLIPCSLSEDTPPQDVVPAAVIDRIRTLDLFIVENAKSARAFLRACGHPRPLRELAMAELNEHTPPGAVAPLLAPLRDGKDAGLLSEAGAPAVADPGAALVAAAHAEGITVVPLSGPSSIILALMASGPRGAALPLRGLPADAGRRAPGSDRRARAAVGRARRDAGLHRDAPIATMRFSPTWRRHAHPDTRLSVAADLTGAGEFLRLDRIAQWRARPTSIGKASRRLPAAGEVVEVGTPAKR